MRIRLVALLATLLLLWACYPASEITCSNPQGTTTNQWLIEFRPDQARLRLTMRYRREGSPGLARLNSESLSIN
jgi:hypothetical protein